MAVGKGKEEEREWMERVGREKVERGIWERELNEIDGNREGERVGRGSK